MQPAFIKSAKDLQTKRQAICDGFLFQALQKTEKAAPFVKKAKAFALAIKNIESNDELLELAGYREELAAACGFSDKGRSHLAQEGLSSAIKQVLQEIAKDSGADFKEEIIFRYLLTKGDSLGGSMRNITGRAAQTKLEDKILIRLEKMGHNVQIVKSSTGKTQRISWDARILLFDAKPRIVGNSIDLILLDSKGCSDTKKLLGSSLSYIACGELKGGIDPAGADEHWKTANSALGRIRDALKQSAPALFFVGAAIEPSMAEEIFAQLEDGRLAHAANLNAENQLDDLVDWLMSL